MRRGKWTIWKTIAIVIATTAMSLRCFAELGGAPSLAQTDALHMKGSPRIAAQVNYSIQEIRTAADTIVREYVTTDGVVFAVSWRGRAIPDLQQLLGPYFSQYIDLGKAQHAGHGRLAIETSKLVAHSGGHMRAFFGHAYVPQLLPNNFQIDEIR